MHCPHCKTSIESPPEFWQARVAPWSCSYCGGLYGISNNNSVFPVPTDFRPLSPLLHHQVAIRWCYYAHPCNYVYALCYPTGIPFYVGLGVKDRAVSHVLETKRMIAGKIAPLPDKNREIAHLRNLGLDVWYHFLALTRDREEACAAESFWINYWEIRSRGGLLTNLAYPDSLPELTQENPPPIPIGVSASAEQIKVFCHPDIVVCPPSSDERVGSMVPLARIDCNACGVSSIADESMRGKHLICPDCGHYVFGMDFRERFPLKQFVEREFVWQYRRKSSE